MPAPAQEKAGDDTEAAIRGCTPLSSVPQAITRPGRYCLTRDVTTGSSAFTIMADDVEIDLSGHTITGPLHSGTNHYCISSFGLDRITIRNGAIRGCAVGVYLSDFFDMNRTAGLPGGGHRVENLDVYDAKFRGIRVEGRGNVIRNNVLRYIGGSTFFTASHAFAIEAIGQGAVIEGNMIHETRGPRGFEGVGISISQLGAANIVRRNLVSLAGFDPEAARGASPGVGPSTWGIWIGGADTRGMIVEGNRIVNAAYGITVHRSSQALLVRNTVAGAVVPYYLPTLTGTPLSTFSEENVCDLADCVETVEFLYVVP